ncbi:MAG: RHS repeat protein [Algicola sp.]|nr:RHS repeat protein [Algicola sp.]
MIKILKNQQKRASFITAMILALLSIIPAYADDVMVVPQSHVSDFPNEYIGVQTRKVGFEYDDVVIPGNAGMDIIVTRRQSGIAVKFDNLLMKTANTFASDRPLVSTTCLGDFKTLSIMHKGTRLAPAGYKYVYDLPAGVIAVFTNNIYLACDKTNNSIAVLHFANGRKHTFTQSTSVTTEFAVDASYVTDTTTDRFGNSITYGYEADVQPYLPKRLKTITRNDGEVVTFVYGATDITYPTWTPQYLKEITYLGKKVQYDFTGGKLNYFTDSQDRKTHYEYSGYTGIGEQITKITLPDGLTASYSHSALIDNGSLRLPTKEAGFATSFSLADMGYSGGQLLSKTISGPGISPRTHSYMGMADSSVLVTQFNYKNDLELMTHYSFATGGRISQMRRFEGALANEHDRTKFDTHTLVYQQDIAWQALDSYTIGCLAATSITEALTFDCTRRVMDTKTTTIAYSGGNDTFVNQVMTRNAYGLPTKQSETLSYIYKKRMTTQTYDHDVDNWILNQPRITKVGYNETNLAPVKEQTYYPKTHPSYPFYPEQTRSFGQWQQQISEYHADGNIKKVEFNQKLTFGNTSANRYESYSNYKRGQAQTITVPARYGTGVISKTSIITDTVFGSTLNTTDFNGNKVNFGYDKINRPLYIDHVDTSVADTLYSYTAGTSALGAVVTTQRCQLNSDKTACSDTSLLSVTPALTTTTTFDGFFNPILVVSSTTDQTLYKNMAYNVFNKPLFASYPATTSTHKQGLTFTYDALQRLTSVAQSGGGTVLTGYLAGNKTKVTDAENNVTTTTYLDYALPTYQQPILIISPENLTTTLEVNAFGEVESITQSGKNGTAAISQTQTNLYDSTTHQLCMVKRTDVGNTFFNYNELGQVTWQAQGVSSSSCFGAAYNANDLQKVSFGYDNLGSQHTVNYDDGTPQRTLTRDSNGNVKSIQGGGYSQSYNYTSTNQLDDETLNVLTDNKSFTLDYGYSSLGNLSTLKYPGDTTQVNFAPNGFGQATQAIRVYAQNDTVEFVKAGAAYYPTGVMKNFTYGNGVVHTASVNTRGMPEQLHERISNTDVVNLTYSYDFNSNITSIANPRDNGIFGLRALTYDGLDRLTSTAGGDGIGNSTLSYDSLGNIRTYKNTSLFNSHDLAYGYDSNFRLQSLTGAGSTGYDFAQASTPSSDTHDSYNARGSVIHNGK